jgi:hypothetical protein
MVHLQALQALTSLLIHGQAYCAVFKMPMLAKPAFVRLPT